MNNFKSIALGLGKWIGLIALSLLINVAPMLFLRLGEEFTYLCRNLIGSPVSYFSFPDFPQLMAALSEACA